MGGVIKCGLFKKKSENKIGDKHPNKVDHVKQRKDYFYGQTDTANADSKIQFTQTFTGGRQSEFPNALGLNPQQKEVFKQLPPVQDGELSYIGSHHMLNKTQEIEFEFQKLIQAIDVVEDNFTEMFASLAQLSQYQKLDQI